MPLRQKVREIMVPLDQYAVVSPEATLREAVSALRGSYCQLDTGYCTEAGPRTVMVVNEGQQLVGILDFASILKVLVPEVAGTLSQKIQALEVSVVFAEAGIEKMDISQADLKARVEQNAQVKVKQIMLPSRVNVEAETDVLSALKLIFRKKITKLPVVENGKLVGVVRDADLFMVVADIAVG